MHVITQVAWCSFSSFISFSFVLYPLSFNMFLWHLFAMYSLVISIVVLIAPTPSDAMPVNVSLHFPLRGRDTCRDGRPHPCACDDAYGIGYNFQPNYCGPVVYAYASSPDSGVLDDFLTLASHHYGDDITM
jgi:hypothetical protein